MGKKRYSLEELSELKIDKEEITVEDRETGEEKTIVFGLTGTGYFDMVAYEKFHDGEMDDYIPTDEELKKYAERLPKI